MQISDLIEIARAKRVLRSISSLDQELKR